MNTETYIPDDRYKIAVKAITASLNRAYRRRVDPADARMNAAAALVANLPTAVGNLQVDLPARHVGIEHHDDLVQALADLRPDVSEQIEESAVVIALGEFGNIWPESVRPTPQEAAQALTEAAHQITRPMLSDAISVALEGRSVFRDHLQAVRASVDRQLQAAADAAPLRATHSLNH